MKSRLPIFALNAVVFPHTPMMLHVFEPRYLDMINTVIRADKPFGILLIKHGQETLGPLPETYQIGCTARIMQVDHLRSGRMNILVTGEERFKVLERYQDEEYLTVRPRYSPLSRSKRKQLSSASSSKP